MRMAGSLVGGLGKSFYDSNFGGSDNFGYDTFSAQANGSGLSSLTKLLTGGKNQAEREMSDGIGTGAMFGPMGQGLINPDGFLLGGNPSPDYLVDSAIQSVASVPVIDDGGAMRDVVNRSLVAGVML